jgi:hypothetical protein
LGCQKDGNPTYGLLGTGRKIVKKADGLGEQGYFSRFSYAS